MTLYWLNASEDDRNPSIFVLDLTPLTNYWARIMAMLTDWFQRSYFAVLIKQFDNSTWHPAQFRHWQGFLNSRPIESTIQQREKRKERTDQQQSARISRLRFLLRANCCSWEMAAWMKEVIKKKINRHICHRRTLLKFKFAQYDKIESMYSLARMFFSVSHSLLIQYVFANEKRSEITVQKKHDLLLVFTDR